MCGFADSSWKEISGPFTCTFGSYYLYTQRMGFLPALHRLLPCCSNTTVRKTTCSLLWVLVHRLADCRLCPLLRWVILRTGLEFHRKTKLTGYKYYHLLLVSADRGKAWVTGDRYMWVMPPASLFLREVLVTRQWHPTAVLLPDKSHGRRSLVGCSPWVLQESDTTEWLHFHFSLSCIGGNGNPLQCSCLENPRDGAAVNGVTQNWTRLKWLSSRCGCRGGTLKSLLQHHSSKASILRRSAFFTVQLSHPYMTTGKTIALTRQTFVGKVMSLLFSMLSRLVITFLPRSKRLLISWLQSPSAVILEPKK